MHRIIFALLAVSLILIGQTVCAHDRAEPTGGYLLSQSYFEDQSNALTASQVKQETFTPYYGVLSKGYKASTFWLKLKVKATAQPLVLKIRPVYNEEIEIFDPSVPEGRPLVGAKYPSHANEHDGSSFNFSLPPQATDRDVYLRIKSARAYMVYAEVMSQSAYQRADRREQMIAAAYTAFTLILAAGLCLLWIMNRERVLALFTIQQFLAFLHAFFHVGLASTLLDSVVKPQFLNYVLSCVVVIYPLTAFIANKSLLSEYGLKPFFKKVCNAFIVLSVGVIALFFAGERIALMLNANLVLVVMALFTFIAWFGLNPKKSTFKAHALPLAVLRGYYSFNLLIWVVTLIPILGFASFGEIALYTLYVYNLLGGLVVFFILQYRAQSLHKLEVERSSLLAFEAQKERQQREEQGMLLAMLTHEIKTPLSVLKLVLDEKVAGSDLEGHANRAVSNINAILNRCLQLDKLDAKAIQLNRTALNCRTVSNTLLGDYQANPRVRVRVANGLNFYADQEVLKVVLTNLVENALKYAADDSPIEIEVTAELNDGVEGVRIIVRNAIGPMGAPDAERVFKKFYRNIQATKITGSGLGLFLVHELVTVMGGSVSFVSDNQEVTFSVWIPA